jgi:hypothetical protein
MIDVGGWARSRAARRACVSQETLLTMDFHLLEPEVNRSRKKLVRNSCERRRPRAPENHRSPCEMKFVNGLRLQERTEQTRTAFTNNRAHPIISLENAQHRQDVNARRIEDPKIGRPSNRETELVWHSLRGKGDYLRAGGSENLPPEVDLASVAHDHAEGLRSQPESPPPLLKIVCRCARRQGGHPPDCEFPEVAVYLLCS